MLHDVRFDGRPVLHRGSCAEMIVPYGEPHPMHAWRTYFDAGEYGLGACTNSLELGCDCVGEIRYLDAHLVDRGGRPRTLANAICLHEEDAGLLLKHSDELAGRVEVRSARRFVVNSMVTVGNYDYAFRWYLGLDGSIECEVQLHGVVSTMALAPGEQPVGQHDRRPRPRRAEPPALLLLPPRSRRRRDAQQRARGRVRAGARRAPRTRSATRSARACTPLASESEARRDSDERAARVWHVVNPGAAQRPRRRDRLSPGAAARRLDDARAARTRASRARAGFAAPHALGHAATTRRSGIPSGRYPYGTRETIGLPQWSEADRPLEETDVVLWYTVGTTHFVRPEDWPIMPVARVRASGSSPSGSSTATRRSTSRRRMPATAGVPCGLDLAGDR